LICQIKCGQDSLGLVRLGNLLTSLARLDPIFSSVHDTAQQNILINFGRQPQWNCPIPEDEAGGAPASPAGTDKRKQQQAQQEQAAVGSIPVTDGVQPWFIPPIPCYEPEDGIFYAHIGPTGGKAGYESITGKSIISQ
jgi:hypothetical protein